MQCSQAANVKEVDCDLIYKDRKSWNPEKDKLLLAPYDYLYNYPGKDLRSQLLRAMNKWLQVPADSLKVVTKVTDMLHTASLLVDDVQDSSSLRRGAPVAHKIYGAAQTINSANYVYFIALQELSKLRTSGNAIKIYTEELLNLHRGQGMDLFWRENSVCPTESEYLEMVHNKTGGLIRLATKLLMAESSIKLDLLPLANTIGLLYQILDDYLNLCDYSSLKGFCDDLTEGKFSFPVIHAIRTGSSNLALISILRQRTADGDLKRYALQLMESAGSLEHCRNFVTKLRAKAEDLIDDVGRQTRSRGDEGAEAMRLILNLIVDKMDPNV